jgi:hypothetical protein
MSQNPAYCRANFCCPEVKELRPFDLQPTEKDLYWDLISRKIYPGITTILKATWVRNNRKISRKKIYCSKVETDWTARNNQEVGIGFHERMEQRLTGGLVDEHSDLIKSLVCSVERAGIFDRLNFNKVIERFIPWDGNGYYPYVTRLDWFGLMDNEPTVIEWTWSAERLTKLPQLYDKPLQVTAQVKACRDFFALEVKRAVIVVAHPFGEATTFTIEYDRLKQCWTYELLPRLRQFYEGLGFPDAK